MKSAARRLPWLAYAAFWLGVGLFFSLAEWQHDARNGGRHPIDRPRDGPGRPVPPP